MANNLGLVKITPMGWGWSSNDSRLTASVSVY